MSTVYFIFLSRFGRGVETWFGPGAVGLKQRQACCCDVDASTMHQWRALPRDSTDVEEKGR